MDEQLYDNYNREEFERILKEKLFDGELEVFLKEKANEAKKADFNKRFIKEADLLIKDEFKILSELEYQIQLIPSWFSEFTSMEREITKTKEMIKHLEKLKSEL